MKVKELLSDESKWTRLASARDKGGSPALATEDCDCYCIFGAIAHCYGFAGMGPIYAKVRDYLKRSPVAWNDDPATTFPMVRNVAVELNI